MMDFVNRLYQVFAVIDAFQFHISIMTISLIVMFDIMFRKERTEQNPGMFYTSKVMFVSLALGVPIGALMWFICTQTSTDPRLFDPNTGLLYFIVRMVIVSGPVGYSLMILRVQLTAIRTEEPQS